LSFGSVASGKIIFTGWKKNCSNWKNIFPSYYFSIFPHEKTGKVKKIFCYHFSKFVDAMSMQKIKQFP
jgi:hypothetical protein